MTIIVSDTFTGSAGQLLAHTGEIGGWTQDSFYNNDPTDARLSGATGKLYALNFGATIISNVVAPSLDQYAEFFMNTGCKASEAAGINHSLNLWFHYQLNWSPDPKTLQLGIRFTKSDTQLVASGYIDNPFSYFFGSGYADGAADIKLRVEARQSIGEVTVLINDVLIKTYSGSNIYPPDGPTVPGLFRFDIDQDVDETGPNGLTITSLEVGTLGPPPAFWTGYRGTTEVLA